MKITPQDILNQEFSTEKKGFSQEEVSNFLAIVSSTLGDEVRKSMQLDSEVKELRQQLSKHEKREEVIRDTLVSAQKFSKEIKDNAHKEGELILRESELKGEEIVTRAMVRRDELNESIRHLNFKRKEIEMDLLNMLKSLTEMVKTYEKDDGEYEKVEYISQK